MIQLKPIEKEQRPILENLLQLYLHDISLYYPVNFDNTTGQYIYDVDQYFTQPNHHGFFIMNQDEIAGFALVTVDCDHIRPEDVFILNQHKDKGLGTFALNRLFDKFSGHWEIRVVPNSKRSEKLWTRVVKEYTNGNHQTDRVGNYGRLVINFSNK